MAAWPSELSSGKPGNQGKVKSKSRADFTGAGTDAGRGGIVAYSTVWGLAGSILLFSFYFGILAWAQGLSHAREQFEQDRLYVLPIIVGFGLQIALYAYLRALVRRCNHMESHAGGPGNSTAMIATSTGTSTVSMIACCAHHLVDVLPLVGLSAASVFLAKYRIPFLVAAIASNAVGIVVVARAIGKVREVLRKA